MEQQVRKVIRARLAQVWQERLVFRVQQGFPAETAQLAHAEIKVLLEQE